MRRPPRRGRPMFSHRLTPQAAILFASPLFLSPIQSSCSRRRRRRLASNGRVCWPGVKQARRERGGRRKEGRKEGGNKKDMFRMQWRTRSLGQTERGGEGSAERRDATSRPGNWQDETSSSLERAVYLLLVRPTESLKLLSCTGMSGEADQPETN